MAARLTATGCHTTTRWDTWCWYEYNEDTNTAQSQSDWELCQASYLTGALYLISGDWYAEYTVSKTDNCILETFDKWYWLFMLGTQEESFTTDCVEEYKCYENDDPVNMDGICYLEQDNVNYIQKCGNNDSTPLCLLDAGNNYTCQAEPAETLLLPGRWCNDNAECKSNDCQGYCVGKQEGVACANTEECDVGLTCSTTCVNQTDVGGNCTTVDDCCNGATCVDGTCVAYFSISDGVYVAENSTICNTGNTAYEQNDACASGVCYDLKCVAGPKLYAQEGAECNIDDYCGYSFDIDA